MTEQKDTLKSFVGTYTGKELKNQGTSKTGNEYTIFTMMFKENIQDQYPKKFSAFSNCKGMETLQEGNRYTVVYKENKQFNHNVGKDIVYKTAVLFKEPTEQPQQTLNEPSQVNTDPDEEFVIKYWDKCKAEGKEPDFNEMAQEHHIIKKLWNLYNIIRCKE